MSSIKNENIIETSEIRPLFRWNIHIYTMYTFHFIARGGYLWLFWMPPVI